MKLGFIGAGNIATRHAANLEFMDLAEVIAVCDVDELRARSLAKPFGARIYDTPDRMFDMETDLDAVLLCAPPSVRKTVFARAVEADVHVFCEKPPADTEETAEEIAAMIHNSGILCSVDFHSRYSRVLPAYFEVVSGHSLSSVQSSHVSNNAFSPTMPPWFFIHERSGGHVMDQAIHTIDLLRYLVSEIVEVHTLANNRAVPKSQDFTIADTTCTLLQFENGVSGTHLHSWGSHIPKRDLTFVGREIQLSLRPYSPPRLSGFRWLGERERESIKVEFDEGPSMGREIKAMTSSGSSPPDPPHFEALKSFLLAIQGGRNELIKSNFDDAAKTLSVVLAMNQSATTGQPVRLD